MIVRFDEYLKENNPFPEYVPMVVRGVVCDWFNLRKIEDKNFDVFFKRIWDRDYERYNEMLRIEAGKARFDWLVNLYEEFQSTEDGYQNTNTTSNGSVLNVLDGSTTRTEDFTNNGTTENTTNSTNKSDGINQNVTLQKTNPMSVSYQNGLVNNGFNSDNVKDGELYGLDWKSPSSQTENNVKESNNSNTNATENGTTNNTINGTESFKDDTTNTTTNQSVTDGKIESGTLLRHIRTGRNESISKLLREARAYITNSSAWEWLQMRLEVCFIGIYDIDEEEENGTITTGL